MTSSSTLPDEIVVDIMSRLPAKSVGLCRCVCKSWRSMLSKPEFIKNHVNRSRNHMKEALIFSACYQDQGFLYYAPLKSAQHLFDEITISVKKLNFPGYPDAWVQICGSCDGLVLVWGMGNLFVLNPTTREVRKVPPLPIDMDPIRSYIMCGFGYDYVNDDYKIVTVSCYDDTNFEVNYTKAFVNGYSLKTNAWKSVDSPLYWSSLSPVIPGVFVDGSIHWVGCSDPDSEPSIMAFDLAEEKFHKIPPPGLLADVIMFRCLGVLGGNLCTYSLKGTDVYVMKEYGVKESWTRYIVDNNKLDAYELKPVCMLGQDNVILLKDDGKLVIQNFEEGTMRKIVVHGFPRNHLAEESFVFMETLASPHGPWH